MAANGRQRLRAAVIREGSIQVEEICATTGIGYLRPAPATTMVYTYSGDGAAILTPPADR